MKDSPIAGRDYPSSLVEVRSWFRSDADCLDYLDWLRWPEGFYCPWCAGVGEWSAFPGMHRCSDCGRRFSVSAGTIFHRTRTPLTVWFEAAWLMMLSKQGISALNLQRTVGSGSYQTAWTLLHRFRAVMAAAGHEQLAGRVEMDESFIGGKREGARRRGQDHGGRGNRTKGPRLRAGTIAGHSRRINA